MSDLLPSQALPDRFWLTKILALIENPNIEQIQQNSRENTSIDFNHLSFIFSESDGEIVKYIETAHQITDASDRAILKLAGLEPTLTDKNLVEVSHLLSGACLDLNISYSDYQNFKINSPIAINNSTNYKELFWWLWRCLPEIICQQLNNKSAILLPAATVLPDASIWSHNSLASAIAGCLVGYQRPNAEPPKQPSIPYLATFSFSPIQELIKASRKMRDFWAGSWVLHYLSAKICWQLAWKYGPDSLIYPSLYGQPLIDHWILQQPWKNFASWLNSEDSEAQKRALLTAGFPNVIVILLPEAEVEAAMNNACTTLIKEWLKIGKLVFKELSNERYWTRNLQPDNPTWKEWLRNQWQTYWTALPITPHLDNSGNLNDSVFKKVVSNPKELSKCEWTEKLNHFSNLQDNSEKLEKLFTEQEREFIAAVQAQNPNAEVNVGSWWAYIFDQLRFTADSVKNSRSWHIPSAFIARSTISGIGSAVYPVEDFQQWQQSYREQAERQQYQHITEGDIGQFWEQHAGLFDGSEKLNATEVLKRSLHHVLTRLLYPKEKEKWEERWSGYYPNLSSGVAGWLRTNRDKIDDFRAACRDVKNIVDGWKIEKSEKDFLPHKQPWGIPWVDETPSHNLLNPRLLNAKWLIEDFDPGYNLHIGKQVITCILSLLMDRGLYRLGLLLLKNYQNLESTTEKTLKETEFKKLKNVIAKYFSPGKNPTDWYVIAVGDGDGMGKWLKGENLGKYKDYIPQMLSQPSNTDDNTAAIYNAFEQLTQIQKRMGPSTHNALSRALLDFSNQLVPYLTEQRYAGRLIYGGGDDVLAYTNFWEWDSWLWDIHECFRGAKDPLGEFKNDGDYWQWQGQSPKNALNEDWQPRLQKRPLFTMGSKASVSFGVVIAYHSVPLAIALKNLWQAEASAKEYKCGEKEKDAVQVRVLFGSGNILKATSRFKVFKKWRKLLNNPIAQANPAIFEKAAQWWEQHPAPNLNAIEDWTRYFCQCLDVFKNDQSDREEFTKILYKFLRKLYKSTADKPKNLDKKIQSWLKLTAFVLRDRIIECKKRGES